MIKMKQRAISSSHKHNLSRNSKLFSVRTTSEAFQTKEEKLFENKSFLEIILGLIKKTQNDVLSDKMFKKLKSSFSYSSIKDLLKELKKDLIEINEEENKKVLLNQNLLIEKKRKMKEIIFNSNDSQNLIHNSDNKNEIKSKNEKFIYENNEVEQRKEINQLKMLNFKMENEIQKVDNLYNRMLFEKDYNKFYLKTGEDELEPIYIRHNDNKIVNHILHNKLTNRRRIFIRKANMKNKQDMCINRIKEKISQFKKDVKELYQYYNEYIISEEEKSYIETIVDDMKNKNIDNDISDENSMDNNIEINKELMKEKLAITDKNSSNKDSSNNEETCPNSSEKTEKTLNELS